MLCTACPFRKATTTKIDDIGAFVSALKSAPLACVKDNSCPCNGQNLSDPDAFASVEDMQKWHEQLPGKGWQLNDGSEDFPLAK